MTWLAGDGFDFYNTVADAQSNTAVWSSITSCVLVLDAGRFGGNIMLVGNNSLTPGNLNTVAFANSNVLFVNMNMLSTRAHVNGGTTPILGFSWTDAGGKQGGVFLRDGGDFIVTNGAIGGGGLAAASAVLVPFSSTWFHIQVKVVVHNTAGSIELRLNGSTTPNWSVTGINTRNASSNFFANGININSADASSEYVDDFYVFNDQSPAPSTFQGDVHAIQQFPTSDNAITWARNTGPNNCLAVDEPHQDGDTTYVATNVINNTDIYGLTQLPVTPDLIVAVCPKYNARHDDAGPHTVTASLTSAGTTVNLPNYNTTTTYGFQQSVYTVDPHTSAAWTAAAVNALLLSIKDVL